MIVLTRLHNLKECVCQLYLRVICLFNDIHDTPGVKRSCSALQGTSLAQRIYSYINHPLFVRFITFALGRTWIVKLCGRCGWGSDPQRHRYHTRAEQPLGAYGWRKGVGPAQWRFARRCVGIQLEWRSYPEGIVAERIPRQKWRSGWSASSTVDVLHSAAFDGAPRSAEDGSGDVL